MRLMDSAEESAGERLSIVFIHGAGLNGTIWEHVASGLSVPCLSAEYPYRDEA